MPETDKTVEAKCVEMLLRSLRSKSEAAKQGYVAAAQWFALATKSK